MNVDDEHRLTHAEAIMLGPAAGPIMALLTHYFILRDNNYPLGLAIFAGEGLTLGWLTATFARVALFC